MPWYEIEHIVPLTRAKCDELAQRITDYHAQKFTTPTLFVNVHFRDASDDRTYVAGKAKPTNRIRAYVRVGDRTQAEFDELALTIVDVWNAVVNAGEEKPEDGNRELQAVFVIGEIVAGVEAGLVLPQAGKDVQWAQEMMPQFEETATLDTDVRNMVQELNSREEFKMSGIGN